MKPAEIDPAQIPNEVEDAAAKQLYYSLGGGQWMPWEDQHDTVNRLYRFTVRPVAPAALSAWLGANTEPRNWRTTLILPLSKEGE